MADIDHVERAAAHGEALPENADMFDELRWFGLSYVYGCVKKNIYTKEQASVYKKGLVKEVEYLRKKYEFAVKCWEAAGERYKAMEKYLSAYMKDKTIENADKMATAFYGFVEEQI